MEKTETRLLEEWKANLDLLKFYEALKQQRVAHFLTIQTAFLAVFFGLLAKEAIGVFSLVIMATLAVIPIAPLFIAFYFMRLDARSRAFIDTANTRLLLIEDEWKKAVSRKSFRDLSTAIRGATAELPLHRHARMVPLSVSCRGRGQDFERPHIRRLSRHCDGKAIKTALSA